jgi:hypothetical protein
VSGAHRIQKPRGRLVLAVRLPGRYALAAFANLRMHMAAARDWCSCHVDDVLDWLDERFSRRTEDFWAEPPATQTSVTSPDPIPAALPAPIEPAGPEPEPLELTPREALTSFHTVHPLLPGESLRWNLGADSIHGEVNALDCNPLEQRNAVNNYAAALGVEVREQDAGDGHILLTATGSHAGVTVIVTAVLIVDDTIPLRVYREATSTQETQAIPQEVLEQVMSA